MECQVCGSKLYEGDPICRVCGSKVQQYSQMNSQNLSFMNNNQANNIINQPRPSQFVSSQVSNPINNNLNRRTICYDFVCPCCRTRIPENQLYQFIQRPILMNNQNNVNGNINSNMFNNMANNNANFSNLQTNPNSFNNLDNLFVNTSKSSETYSDYTGE